MDDLTGINVLYWGTTQMGNGDLVKHPISGYYGIVVGMPSNGMYAVDWVIDKNQKTLSEIVYTSEDESMLLLVNKSAAA
jgi:hypothetical protein|tara:strand:+ start:604 stop:840 length:237 start_codon:yes stop_codon:yes gene_type:complete